MLEENGNNKSNLVANVHQYTVTDEGKAVLFWKPTNDSSFCIIGGTDQNIKHVR